MVWPLAMAMAGAMGPRVDLLAQHGDLLRHRANFRPRKQENLNMKVRTGVQEGVAAALLRSDKT
jgi:hypothetical protein